MKREYFIMHLEAFGCTLIRHDNNAGYSAYRHRENKTKSGVPKEDSNGELSHGTICRVCKTLGIEVPKEVQEHGVLDFDVDNRPRIGADPNAERAAKLYGVKKPEEPGEGTTT